MDYEDSEYLDSKSRSMKHKFRAKGMPSRFASKGIDHKSLERYMKIMKKKDENHNQKKENGKIDYGQAMGGSYPAYWEKTEGEKPKKEKAIQRGKKGRTMW